MSPIDPPKAYFLRYDVFCYQLRLEVAVALSCLLRFLASGLCGKSSLRGAFVVGGSLRVHLSSVDRSSGGGPLSLAYSLQHMC